MIYNPFSTKGFAIQIAKGMRRALQSAQRKHPPMTRNERYLQALQQWFAPLEAAVFLAKAEKLVALFDAHPLDVPSVDFNFRWLVKVLVIEKYQPIRLRDARPTPQATQDLMDGVDSIISETL
jgi:hypothetical protein